MKLLKSKKKLIGQGMTEYLVIVGVIGIGALAAFTYMGGTLRESAAGMSAALVNDGTTADAANVAAAGNAGAANENTGEQSTLANFGTQQVVSDL